MRSSLRIGSLDDRGDPPKMSVAPTTHHLDRVYAVVGGKRAHPEAICASWKRSATNHNLDPASGGPPRIPVAGELRGYREKVEKLIATAREELDDLYRIVSRARYVVLLSDEHGVT